MWVVSLEFEGVVGGGGSRKRDVGGVERIKGRISAKESLLSPDFKGRDPHYTGPCLAGRATGALNSSRSLKVTLCS